MHQLCIYIGGKKPQYLGLFIRKQLVTDKLAKNLGFNQQLVFFSDSA